MRRLGLRIAAFALAASLAGCTDVAQTGDSSGLSELSGFVLDFARALIAAVAL